MNLTPLARKRIAISIEAGIMRVLVLRGGRIQRWLSLPLLEELPPGSAPSPWAIDSLLRTLHARRGRFFGQVALCFSSSEALFRTLSIPNLGTSRLVAEAIGREAERELPVNAGQIHLFWQKFRNMPQRQDFFLLGLNKDAFTRLHGAVQEAKLWPRLWDLRPLALVRAVRRPDAIIVNLEREGTELILVAQGVPRLVRSLPERPDITVEERARLVVEQIAQTVSYYTGNQSQEAWNPLTPVVLTGDLAGEPEITQALHARSVLPIEPFTSPFPSPSDFPAHTYAAAIGLLLKRGRPTRGKGGTASIDFNVLPREYRHRLITPRAAAAAVGVATGVALLFPLSHAQASKARELSVQSATLTQIQGRVATAKARLVENREIEKRIEEAVKLATTLRQERNSILAIGGVASTEIRTLADLTSQGVSLTLISVKDESILLEGEAPNYATALDYATLLEQSGRFPSVAVVSLGLTESKAAPGATTFALSLQRRHPGLP